jgi:hypothetical protein
MRTIKRKVLEPLVITEATNIKRIALKRELKKLDFCGLVPDDHKNCIYGQMTGDCYNERAYELIRKSCVNVIDGESDDDKEFNGGLVDFNEQAKLCGVENPNQFVKNFRYSFYSPIEIFITRKRNKKNGNNAKLIAFLRGETDTLEFN